MDRKVLFSPTTKKRYKKLTYLLIYKILKNLKEKHNLQIVSKRLFIS